MNYGDIFNGAVAAILGGVMLKIVEVLAIKYPELCKLAGNINLEKSKRNLL